MSQLGLKDLDVGREVNSLYKDDGKNNNNADSPAATTAIMDDRVSKLRFTDISHWNARLTDSSTTTSSMASTGNTSYNNHHHSRPESIYSSSNTPPDSKRRSIPPLTNVLLFRILSQRNYYCGYIESKKG